MNMECPTPIDTSTTQNACTQGSGNISVEGVQRLYEKKGQESCYEIGPPKNDTEASSTNLSNLTA